MRFMQLTYYKRNHGFPDRSGTSGKRFWLRVENIEEITPYEVDERNIHKCTKVTMTSGRHVEVTEEAGAIIQTLMKMAQDEQEHHTPLF